MVDAGRQTGKGDGMPGEKVVFVIDVRRILLLCGAVVNHMIGKNLETIRMGDCVGLPMRALSRVLTLAVPRAGEA
jgi:hypothetical protein